MLFRSLNLILLAASTVFHSTVAQDSAAEQIQQLQDSYVAQTRDRLSSGGACTPENVVVRREWGDMSTDQRLDYIRAVRCLKSLPAKTSPATAPGARSRHDDFTVAHILNSLEWHFSPWLLSAHRYFGWAMEQALRHECGYSGGLPYWGWERYTDMPMEMQPLLDGSSTSLSGDGQQSFMTQGCNCVMSGPFADWQVTLGPSGGGIGCKQNPRSDGLGYNPRCLEREFHPGNMVNMTYDNIANTIYNSHDITSFAMAIEDSSGLHGNPHTGIGGLQMDIPGSPSDHAFFHHHCSIDRLYALWQSLDWPNRKHGLPSAEPFQRLRQARNWPPAPSIHDDDVIHLSRIFRDQRVGDALSTTDGPYCYMYE